jgi:hypothetical protein
LQNIAIAGWDLCLRALAGSIGAPTIRAEGMVDAGRSGHGAEPAA